MIAVDKILDIVKTTIYSGSLKNEKPLSVILIASVGGGKSEILRKTYTPPKVTPFMVEVDDKKNKGKKYSEERNHVEQIGSVFYTTDSTPYTLYSRYSKLLRSGQIKHIVIPDLLSILTKSKDVMPDTIRFYNCLIEEGIYRIESKNSNFVVETPVQIGLISAVSQQDFAVRSQTQAWGALGFLSRVLPVSWSYLPSTGTQILDSIFRHEYHHEEPFNLTLPGPTLVTIDEKYMPDIEAMALELKDDSDDLGARRMKQLMTFLMSTALMNKRDYVTDYDFDKLIEYKIFFNDKCTALL